MNRCSTGKIMYASLQVAEDALIETRIKFDYATGYGPVGVYRCDDCGLYHITSQGAMNERLAQYIREGKIEREKEVTRWTRKWKP
ncbi:MAG TPA: hypothetical protein VD884_00925 [Ohtaekwangia sp.]|nr:hypothetical protein [Ohtaekwangia sp.]